MRSSLLDPHTVEVCAGAITSCEAQYGHAAIKIVIRRLAEIIRAVRSAREQSGEAKQWRHLKRGSIVTEIGRGRAQASVHNPITDMAHVVIYKHGDDLWVRATDEFEDGRFVAVNEPATLPPPQAGDGVRGDLRDLAKRIEDITTSHICGGGCTATTTK